MRPIRGDDTAAGSIGTDRTAFEAFYLAHFDAVLGFVARRVRDPHTAADLTAEVFVVALTSASTYKGEGPPIGWLMGIARRVVAAEYRRMAIDVAAQRRVSGRRLVDAQDIEELVDRIDAERGAREVFQHLQRLPPGQRAVLELVAVDGLSLAEAAAALNIRPATARVRWFRARRFLRDIPQPGARPEYTPTAATAMEA